MRSSRLEAAARFERARSGKTPATLSIPDYPANRQSSEIDFELSRYSAPPHIPAHKVLKIGTLAAILSDAAYLEISREQLDGELFNA
jgi:hypothetical protein